VEHHEERLERLLGWVSALVSRLPNDVLIEDVFDEEMAEFLDVTSKEPVHEISASVPGFEIPVAYAYVWNLLAFAADKLRFGHELDEIGEHDRAVTSKNLARIACRDALLGCASEELLDHQADDGGDGIQYENAMSAAEYDAACHAAGNIELADAFSTVPRPVRTGLWRDPHRRIVRRQVRVAVRRSRPRERRTSTRRSSSRGSPSRLRPRQPDVVRVAAA
jgi:hypothetical protein